MKVKLKKLTSLLKKEDYVVGGASLLMSWGIITIFHYKLGVSWNYVGLMGVGASCLALIGTLASCGSRLEEEQKKRKEDEHLKELIRQVINENNVESQS